MYMKNEILDKNIIELKLADSANQVLEENQITYFKQLCGKTKTQLKNIGLSYKEICDIEIKLQLEGLDLKNNY